MMLLGQCPYKKKVQIGDVFGLGFPQAIIFGQVVAQNVPFAGFDRCQHKVVVFRGLYQRRSEWPLALEQPLLVPPYYLNNLGFSRGYMPVLGNAPAPTLQAERYCYRDVRKGFVDERGAACEERPLIGEYGFGNYLTLMEHVRARI